MTPGARAGGSRPQAPARPRRSSDTLRRPQSAGDRAQTLRNHGEAVDMRQDTRVPRRHAADTGGHTREPARFPQTSGRRCRGAGETTAHRRQQQPSRGKRGRERRRPPTHSAARAQGPPTQEGLPTPEVSPRALHPETRPRLLGPRRLGRKESSSPPMASRDERRVQGAAPGPWH